MTSIKDQIAQLEQLDSTGMYLDDFLLTWDRSADEIAAVFKTAEVLMGLRKENISSRVFDSGLAVSLFRDNSTRTRFSFSSASNMLGLQVQDLDEGKSQIAHGETVRETANMISFMADVIGIRDDMTAQRLHQHLKSKTGGKHRVPQLNHLPQTLLGSVEMREITFGDIEFASAADEHRLVRPHRLQRWRALQQVVRDNGLDGQAETGGERGPFLLFGGIIGPAGLKQ